MTKAKKIWLITAASLLLLGCIIFGSMMAMLNWDFSKLSSGKYETNRHEIKEAFRDISIDTRTAHISFVPTDNAQCSVECFEQEKQKHTVTVEDGILSIKAEDTRKWYEYIGFDFGTPRITVYLPRGAYGALSVTASTGDLDIPEDFSFQSMAVSLSTGSVSNMASVTEHIKIKTSTGAISLSEITAASLDLSVSTGKVTLTGVDCAEDIKIKVSTGKVNLSDVTCRDLTAEGSTGDIVLKNVIAGGALSVKRSTGDVTFDASDAAEIYVNTDTGDVKGSLLSEKVFIANTDTGKKEVPNSITGGRCEITTDTGDIKITIMP